MKTKKELIAIVNPNGKFVRSYENTGALAYECNLTSKIEFAATVPVEFYELQKEKYEHMAKMFGGQLVKIEAEYEIKTIDGQEPEIAEKTKDEFDQMAAKAFKRFMALKLGGLD